MLLKKKLVVLAILLVIGFPDYAQNGNSYMPIDFPMNWKISTIPDQPLTFPESALFNDLSIGFNRAGISWFRIHPSFFDGSYLYDVGIDSNRLKNHFVRPVLVGELFPEFLNAQVGNQTLFPMNICYYPSERGPNNYDISPSAYSAGIDSMGNLKEPGTRWGGISTVIHSVDLLKDPKINYIGFWLMDPFVYDTLSDGGKLLLHLGNVSEDVLKDGLNSRENCLPSNLSEITGVDTTIWGRIPNRQTGCNINHYDEDDRQYQDVGFDGLRDVDERSFFNEYLTAITEEYGINSPAYLNALDDPSTDNYFHYLDDSYDEVLAGIIERYRKYNGMQGNSCNYIDPEFQEPATNIPDIEDINYNNFLNTEENYYQYTINLDKEHLVVGQNFINKKMTVIPSNGDGSPVNWYRFHIPIHTPEKEEFGDIDLVDLSTMLRLILKDFKNPVCLRLEMFGLMEGNFSEPVVNNPGDVLIYPNPVQDFLNLVYLEGQIKSVRINDMSGRLVLSEIFSYSRYYQRMDLTQLNRGTYLISVETDSKIFHQKFIKSE